MELYRELPRDLRLGALGVKDLYDKLLWANEREKQVDFDRRVRALQWEPFYWSAAEHLGGQPFTKDINFSSDTPSEFEIWKKNIDGTGRDLRNVARTSCIASVGYGLNLLWPVFDEGLDRPVIRTIPANSVLDPYEEGHPVRVLMTDIVLDPDKPWRKIPIEQVWIFWDGEPTAAGDEKFARFEVFEHKDRANPESEWNKTPTEELGGFFAPLTKVPLVPLHTGSNPPERLPWVIYPPLHDLAVLNRVWMNKVSDLDFGLHHANVPQRAASGINSEEIKKINTISYKGLWWTANPQGKFYFVEHTGASFEISRQDIQQLERRAEVMGHMPNVTRSDANSAMTATGELRDMSRAITTAQAWAFGWQDAWETALRMMAQIGSLDQKFTVELHTSFGPRERDLERARIIQQDFISGALEPQQYFEEMKRLAVYTETFDADQAALNAEAQRQAVRDALRLPPPATAEQPPEDEEQEEETA